MSHASTIIYLEDRIPSIARQLSCQMSDIRRILDTIDDPDLVAVLEAVEIVGADIVAVRDYLSFEVAS